MIRPTRFLFTVNLKLAFSLSLLLALGACGSSSSSSGGTPPTPAPPTQSPTPPLTINFTPAELYGKYWATFAKGIHVRLNASQNILDQAMLVNGFADELNTAFPEVEALLKSNPANRDEAKATLARIEKVADSYSRYLQSAQQVFDGLDNSVETTQDLITNYKKLCTNGPTVKEIPTGVDSAAYVTEFKNLCSEKTSAFDAAETYLKLPELLDLNSNNCDTDLVKTSDVAVEACRASFLMAVTEHFAKRDRQTYNVIKERSDRILARAKEILLLTGP
jgi:hypothetical protein